MESALCGLSVISRPDSEGSPRTLLQWVTDGGVASWYHNTDTTRARMAEAFPALTSIQLDQACLAVAGLVRAAQSEGPAPSRRRSEWASWKPIRSIEELH
ncbi:hypothetical protein [Methylogaea oryzae]|uniref:hypothetical protein n=1 Tax=Methylogaea oryzae TaxID=1295382 RepID=UPI0012E26D9A|nr:hypothetical protein [Methylogaea oryzae]